ncbi:hypothetical protein CYG48_02680 [Neorhizobium sp. SOG26]|nr:BrnT family toxin [Neorhizobium sp. SOG26]AXV14707.1 hypothetical protein CYG48_02680 [Neorhizobium sp. SOG26]
MPVIFDPEKRRLTLEQRGLDFADADKVFDGPHLTIEDDRIDYGEVRYLTVGMLEQRMVVLVWTPRGQDLRMISMRKANDREQRAYGPRLAGH